MRKLGVAALSVLALALAPMTIIPGARALAASTPTAPPRITPTAVVGADGYFWMLGT